jgi:predicted amidohydrolase
VGLIEQHGAPGVEESKLTTAEEYRFTWKREEASLAIELAAAQIRPRKADYEANLSAVGDVIEQLDNERSEVDLLVLPETVLSGYFLEGGVRELARSADQVFTDLLRTYRGRVKRAGAALDIAIGFYELADGQFYNSGLYATLTSADNHDVVPRIIHVHRKFFLPTYGVFDEKRFVSRGRVIQAFDTRLGRTALLICEDAWHSVTATLAALQGAQMMIVLSASPGREFGGKTIGNLERWDVLLKGIAEEHGVFVIYAGLVGFEGGKGFTGSSRVVDPWGRTLVRAPATEPYIVRAQAHFDDVAVARGVTPLLADLDAAVRDVAAHFEMLARPPADTRVSHD